MIAKSVNPRILAKSVDFADFTVFADFDVVFADFDAVFADFDADFVDFADFTDFGLKLVKLTISFHSTVTIQGETSIFFGKSAKSTESIKSTLKSVDFAKICRFPHFSLNLQEKNICVKRKTILA